MTINEKTFWLETVDILVPAAREFPQRVDVAVIGAGFTGLSAARSLARGGASVAVFETQTIGWGAGSAIYHGGLVDDSSAGVNPARYVAGLARAAERAGAPIFEHSHVDEIQREGAQGWKIATTRGTLRAQNVLVATSGYTSRVTPTLQKKIIPIGSYIIVTEDLP